MAHNMVKGRQYMLCLNHRARDELNRSTLDLDSRQKRQIDVSVTETNSTAHVHVQYRSVRNKRTCIACMKICMLYIALASLIYTWDYVSQKKKKRMKFDQPYLSEKVTRSF